MGIFRRKFKVKARDSRGQAEDDGLMNPADAVKDILVTNYADTFEDYNKLDEDKKETFKTALGDLAEAFENSGTQVDLEIIAMEEGQLEEIFNAINAW